MKSKRVLAISLILSMLASNVVFADQVLTSKKSYTATTQTVNSVTGEVVYQDLTVEEATKKALANSSNLKTLNETKDVTDQQNDYITFSFQYTNSDSTTAENQQTSYSIRSLNNALKQIDLTASYATDAVELQVKNYFNTIKAAQDQIDLYEEDMVIQQKNIQIAEVKKNLGLISQLEYDNTVNTYNTTVASKTDLEITIDNAFRSLNETMGTDLANRYNLILDDVEYQPLGNVDLTSKITQSVASNYNIKILKDAVDLAQYDYDTYQPIAEMTYQNQQKKNTLNEAQRSLNDAETAYRNDMSTLYNSIISYEKDYTDYTGQLDVAKSKYEVTKTQYATGQATEVDVLSAAYTVSQLEKGIDQLVRGHALMVEKFNNPDLVQLS